MKEQNNTGQENVIREMLMGPMTNKRGGLTWRFRIMAHFLAAKERREAWREKYA